MEHRLVLFGELLRRDRLGRVGAELDGIGLETVAIGLDALDRLLDDPGLRLGLDVPLLRLGVVGTTLELRRTREELVAERVERPALTTPKVALITAGT